MGSLLGRVEVHMGSLLGGWAGGGSHAWGPCWGGWVHMGSLLGGWAGGGSHGVLPGGVGVHMGSWRGGWGFFHMGWGGWGFTWAFVGRLGVSLSLP